MDGVQQRYGHNGKLLFFIQKIPVFSQTFDLHNLSTVLPEFFHNH